MVYLIHFAEPYQHARHYLGYTTAAHTLESRLRHHRQGTGAKLLRRVRTAGIEWCLARVWEDAGRDEERRLKRQGGLSRHCPVCRAEGTARK